MSDPVAYELEGPVARASDAGSRPRRLPGRAWWRRQFLRLVGLLALLAIWQFGAGHLGDGIVGIPPVTDVISEAAHLISKGFFWEAMWLTVFRGLVGIAAAALVGVALGLLVAQSEATAAALEPILRTLYPVPRVALYPLIGVLLGLGFTSQVTLVFLECLFPFFFMTLGGARQMNRDLLRVVKNAGAGRISLTLVILRASTPAILAALRIVAPIMITLVVAAQMFAGSTDGLGYLILQDASGLEITPIFAIAVLIGLFGFLLDQFAALLTRVLCFWQKDISI